MRCRQGRGVAHAGASGRTHSARMSNSAINVRDLHVPANPNGFARSATRRRSGRTCSCGLAADDASPDQDVTTPRRSGPRFSRGDRRRVAAAFRPAHVDRSCRFAQPAGAFPAIVLRQRASSTSSSASSLASATVRTSRLQRILCECAVSFVVCSEYVILIFQLAFSQRGPYYYGRGLRAFGSVGI